MSYQASKRGGHLRCIVNEDEVIILGQAVLYLEGYIYIYHKKKKIRIIFLENLKFKYRFEPCTFFLDFGLFF